MIDLATLSAAQGSIIYGADASDYSGFSVSDVGDVNEDGFDDLLIGAYTADGPINNKTNLGECNLWCSNTDEDHQFGHSRIGGNHYLRQRPPYRRSR